MVQWASFQHFGFTAIKLIKNVNKANTYVEKSPLAPLFQRGGIIDFFAYIVGKRSSPFGKGGLRGIFKNYNTLIL